MKRIWLILLLLTCCAWAQPARDGHVQVELVSPQTAIVPGQPLKLGVRFKMDPHWHVYYKNPGVTGFPPRFAWTLPAGWKAGEMAWPVPGRLVQADLHQFVYEDEVLLATEVSVPADFKSDKPVSLSVKADWLACADTCIPGKATTKLTLPVAAAAQSTEAAALWTATAEKLPASAGNIELRCWRLGPKQAFLEFAGEAGDKVDFFPDSDQANMEKAPVWKEGKGLEVPVQEKDERLTGVLSIERNGKRTGVRIDVPIAGKAPAQTTAAAPPSAPDGSLLGALFLAFIGGMILNLMPCVFPVLSLKALSLVRHNEHGNKPAWTQGWVYTLGVLVSVWVIAAPLMLLKSATSTLGWGYQMQSPVFVTCLIILFLGIALNLFGLFEVGEKLTQLASLAENKKGLSESFWSGVVATVAATPCTGPFMASALGYAVAQPAAVGMGIFTLLGLGIAFPYLLLCGIPASRRWLPRPGAWMESFKQGMGFPMLVAVVWFLYILSTLLSAEGLGLVMGALVLLSMAAWVYGRWGYDPEGSVRMKAQLVTALIVLGSLSGAIYVARAPIFQYGAEGELVWVPFSPEKLSELRGQGKPVFIDFTASWCVNCKANELVTLGNKSVIAAFKAQGIVPMKADWTRRDETIGRALAEFGRTGVPFYVYYPPGGEPKTFPEILTPQIVLDTIKN